jgi:endogenous inhibitor of DNA gyrase (YacG/DUF329 family)
MSKLIVTTCPTCGSTVHQTTGDNTNHFIPIDTEKIAVAFAEWKDSNVVNKSSDDFIVIEKGKSMDELKNYNRSHLYQYFIENIYNK